MIMNANYFGHDLVEELITDPANPIVVGAIQGGCATQAYSSPTIETTAWSRCSLSIMNVTSNTSTGYSYSKWDGGGTTFWTGKNAASGQSSYDASVGIGGKTYYGTKCARFAICGAITQSSIWNSGHVKCSLAATKMKTVIYRASTQTIEKAEVTLSAYTLDAGMSMGARVGGAYFYLNIKKDSSDIILYIEFSPAS